MNPPTPSLSANSRSPFAGCVILIAAMAVMVFLLVFSTWGLFRQYNEIVKFTATTPTPVAVSPLEGHEPEINLLAEKLETFRQGLAGDQATQLTLTPADLNLAIAAYEPFTDLRQTFHVQAIEGDSLKIAISFKLNGKPRLARADEDGWMTTDPRYLNATLRAKPQLLGKEVVLQLTAIEVPGATVPVEFMEQMSPYRITERYLTHPLIGPLMAKLTAVAVTDGAVVLKRTPGEVPGDRISADQVDSASARLFKLLGVIASVFLLGVGILIFVGLRAKAKNS